ncbi:MAG TPA: PBP1A family penicillin-binding protein [Limnochordales bacterium]
MEHRTRWASWATLVGLGIAALAGWVVARAWWVVRGFDPDRPPEAAMVFDVRGELVGTVGSPYTRFVPLSRIPRHLQEAVVAIEDTRFFRHPGIDPVGIARAVWVNLRARTVVQGGSTITQQLARTLFLTPERSLVRKLEEAALALMLEARFSKERILELYLNRVYFGEGATGVGAAAQTYFGKEPDQLTLGESALLAALIRAPSALSPYRNPEGALRRRELVLQRMVELGYISPRAAREAAAERLRLAELRGGPAPWFMDYLRPLLEQRFGFNLVHRGGLRVHTGLDLRMQRAAQKALGERQGAIVAVDPRTGDIKAMVGGRDYLESQFNRAVAARRQPGSAFKPFVYAAALQQGWRLNSVVRDVPADFSGYQPRNFRDRYWGPVTLKHALVMSLNVGSVWLASQVGVDRVLRLARAMGIRSLTPEDRHLAITLGGLRNGVTPLEMAEAFAVFAGGGIHRAVRPFFRVVDQDGYVWYDSPPDPGERVLSPQVAYLMTNALQDALQRGTGQLARLGRPAAGKTGTTDGLVSAWFVGYTPQLVAAVYIGNDDGTPVRGTGGTLAAPVWKAFMEAALQGEPPLDFPVPEGVVTGIAVDLFNGLRADGLCRWVELDAFLEGTQPWAWSPCVLGLQPPGRGSRPPEVIPGSEVPVDPRELAPRSPEPDQGTQPSPLTPALQGQGGQGTTPPGLPDRALPGLRSLDARPSPPGPAAEVSGPLLPVGSPPGALPHWNPALHGPPPYSWEELAPYAGLPARPAPGR